MFSFLFCYCGKHHGQKQSGRRNDLFHLAGCIPSLRGVRHELKSETWRQQSWKNNAYCLPPLLLMLSQLSYTTQWHVPRGDSVHSGLDPPLPIINWGKYPTDSLTGQYPEAALHLKFPLSRCVTSNNRGECHLHNSRTFGKYGYWWQKCTSLRIHPLHLYTFSARITSTCPCAWLFNMSSWF